jgi:hypothetical protein
MTSKSTAKRFMLTRLGPGSTPSTDNVRREALKMKRNAIRIRLKAVLAFGQSPGAVLTYVQFIERCKAYDYLRIGTFGTDATQEGRELPENDEEPEGHQERANRPGKEEPGLLSVDVVAKKDSESRETRDGEKRAEDPTSEFPT